MPRRKPVGDDQLLNNPVLALPAPRVTPSHPHKEREHDPYEVLPGAVPDVEGKASKLSTTFNGPPKRDLTPEEKKTRELARSDAKLRRARYARYIDLMMALGGNRTMALAQVYGVSIEEAQERSFELHADVLTGIADSDLGTVLEANDLGLAARARVLSKHLYSKNPAASLKAADMIKDIEGDRGDVGSFESFLRVAKAIQE